jgi:HK97 family phage portal protein
VTALQRWFEPRATIHDPAVPLTADNMLEFLYGGAQSDAGVVVNTRTSLQMSAVFRCVAVTAGVSAALPLHTYLPETHTKVVSPLLRDPHPEMTPLELWRLTYVHRLTWGNGYVQKVRSRAGQIKELWPITPDRVHVERVRSTDRNPGGKLFEVTDDWGTTHVLTSHEIMHMPHISVDGVEGLSPIGLARNAVGLALAAEKAGAKFFGRGAILNGVLEVAQKLQKGGAEKLQQQWEARHGGPENAYKIPVLDAGAKFQPVTMPLKDAQFLETRQFSVPEVARFYGVPLFLLMETQKSTSWGTGLESQARGWVVFDLQPSWLAPTEQRIQKELAPDRDVRYNLAGLLRADTAARGAWYRIMREVGAMNADEIRDLEEMGPIPGGAGQIYLQPANQVPLGDDPEPDDPPAAVDPANDVEDEDEADDEQDDKPEE